MDIVTEIIEMIVGAFTTLGSGVGGAFNDIFASIFLVTTETGTTLSPVAGWGIAFFAISAVLGVVYSLLRKAT